MSDFRCSAASLARDEPLLGTASTVRPFLLLEHPGPWGASILRDCRMPAALRSALADRSASSGVRFLLARRPRRVTTAGVRVFAAYADPHRPWLETTLLEREGDVLDVDFTALGNGHSPGLTATDERILCVCTHGRHDACCAERGRPLAAALALADRDATWEVSHIGGDRFAGNVVVLPDGLYYGRLDPTTAPDLVAATRDRMLHLDHLRGRSGFPTPVQAAEILVRRHTGELRIDAVRLISAQRDGDEVAVRLSVAGVEYVVRLLRRPGDDAHRLTCQATRANRAPTFTLLDISG